MSLRSSTRTHLIIRPRARGHQASPPHLRQHCTRTLKEDQPAVCRTTAEIVASRRAVVANSIARRGILEQRQRHGLRSNIPPCGSEHHCRQDGNTKLRHDSTTTALMHVPYGDPGIDQRRCAHPNFSKHYCSGNDSLRDNLRTAQALQRVCFVRTGVGDGTPCTPLLGIATCHHHLKNSTAPGCGPTSDTAAGGRPP